MSRAREPHPTQQLPARTVAGVLTLLFVAFSITHFTVFEQPLLPELPASQIAEYVRLRPVHLGMGIVLDVVIFALGALLSVALFTLVHESSRGLARAALVLMLLAFGVSMAIELSSFALLALARPGNEVLEPMLAVVTHTRSGGYSLVMLVFSVGLGLAFALLPRAGVLPKTVGLSSAAVCALLFVCTAGQIVAPESFKVPVMVASSLLILCQVGSAFLLLRSGSQRVHSDRR